MPQYVANIKLAVGMGGVATFFALSCVATGLYVKEYFNSLESREHWREKLEQEKAITKLEAASTNHDVQTNPSIRLHYAERRLASSKEKLFGRVAMSCFFGGLFCWGWRGYKRQRQTAG